MDTARRVNHRVMRGLDPRIVIPGRALRANPESRHRATLLDSGSAPNWAHPGMTTTYRRAEFRTHSVQNDTNGQPGALTPWHRVWQNGNGAPRPGTVALGRR